MASANSFKKFRSGTQEPGIPADSWNAMIDVAEAYKRGRLSRGPSGVEHPTGGGIVLVRNDSGSNLEQFQVLGLDVPTILPSDNLNQFLAMITLAGVTPAVGHEDKFAITLEPIADGKMGRAFVSGYAIAKIAVSDEDHEFAEADPGTIATLVSSEASTNAAIVWKESGTGTKWAIVHIGAGGGGAGTLPEGQYQYMVYQMVTQNQGGWDFVMAHPLL